MKRIPLQDLISFTKKILLAVNADHYQADIFANALIWSDLIGRSTHGIWRLPAYAKRLDLGLIKCPCQPTFHHDDLAINVINGDQGLGHYIGHEAMVHAIKLAQKNGIAAVAVYNSNHFGIGAYYVQLAAKQGMIGLAMSNSIAKVAPQGGVKAILGTNPFAFGAPRQNGKSILLDMATAAMAGGQIMKYAEQGKTLPEGIAVDTQGNPIFNPAAINEGVLLPFGGAKGYGLSLMIEILTSVLSGALFSTQVNSMFTNFEQSGGNGHFFIALDIARFIDINIYHERIESLLCAVKNSGLKADSTLFPGETRWKQYEHNLKNGIPLDEATISALKKLSKQYDITNTELFL